MLDMHMKVTAIMPSIFGIPAYSVFVSLGIIAGALYYLVDAKKRGVKSEGAILIVVSAYIFGVLGSKIPLLFEHRDFMFVLTGKSIVGGLLGGMLGVIFVKKLFKIKLKLGNIIAPSVALGMMIGRLGCFFNGCCYGRIASWGFNFGDGQLRLPTQLFEAVFHGIAFAILHYYKNKVPIKGILFKIYVFAYFIFRFFSEFFRENPPVLGNMSIYQIISLVGAVYMGVIIFKSGRTQKRFAKGEGFYE